MAVLHQGRRLSTAKTPAGLVNCRSCSQFYTQELRPEDVQILLALACQRQEREELVGDGAARWQMPRRRGLRRTTTWPQSTRSCLTSTRGARTDRRRCGIAESSCLMRSKINALATTGQSDCHAMLLAGKSCGKSTVLKSVAGVTNDGAIASMAASACTRPGWSQRHR